MQNYAFTTGLEIDLACGKKLVLTTNI